MRVLCCMYLCLFALALASLLVPQVVFAQREIILGHRVIVGSINYCEHTGSSDSYACNLDPAITTYITGTKYTFLANFTNVGAATLSLNSLTATAIKRMVNGSIVDLADNEICDNQIVDVIYDGTQFLLLSEPCAMSKTCELILGGIGSTSPALQNDNDTNNVCVNNSGRTETIVYVACLADSTTGTPTVDVKQSTTAGSSILTGTISCGTGWTAGTLSGTPTLNPLSGSGLATCSSTPCGLAVDFNRTSDGAKEVHVKIVKR